MTKAILFLLGALIPCLLNAQWSDNPVLNTPVCTAQGSQYDYSIAPDGSGGVYVLWRDRRVPGGSITIYGQHLDSTGRPMWPTNGLLLSDTAHSSDRPNCIPDGEGGIFAAWALRGQPTVARQVKRIGPDGTELWERRIWTNSVQSDGGWICMAPDGSGGAYLLTYISIWKLYLHRISSAGTLLWANDGLLVTQMHDALSIFYSLLSDNKGGVYAVWSYNEMPLIYNRTHIIAQRIDSSANKLWGENDIEVTLEENIINQNLELALDGSAGLFLMRKGEPNTAVVHRLRPDGTQAWDSAGIVIGQSGLSRSSERYFITSVSGFQAIAVYESKSNTTRYYSQAQLIDTSGNLQWNNGAPILLRDSLACGGVVHDGKGGVFAALVTNNQTANEELYLQQISNTGALRWPGRGRTISNAQGIRGYSSARGAAYKGMISDMHGGVIAVWLDSRNSVVPSDFDVYAARLNGHGDLTPIEMESFTATLDGQTVRLSWKTALEKNNYGFSVERSEDGRTWSDIGFVPGYGTTMNAQEYYFNDELDNRLMQQPFISYRLRQTDYDGTQSHSPVVEIHPSQHIFAPVLYPLAPNPAMDFTTARFFLPDDMHVSLRIISTLGQCVYEHAGDYRQGMSTVTIKTQQIRPGTYFLVATTSKGVMVKNMFKR